MRGIPAHGIDQVAAEKEQASWLPRIQHEPADNPPPNLYDKPYPHQHIRRRRRPRKASAERYRQADAPEGEGTGPLHIIRDAPELRPSK